MENIKFIVAIAEDGIVGTSTQQENGTYLPWDIKSDMSRFRTLTKGVTVVMGRTTWETIPPKFRPLPGRNNIVMSNNPNYVADGALIRTRDEVLEYAEANPDETVWIIGGPTIYNLFVNYVEELHITQVHAWLSLYPNVVKGGTELLQALSVEGLYSNKTWEVVSKEKFLKNDTDSYGSTYAVLQRKLEK